MHHFVTGAAGFIGSQLVDDLLARGDALSGVDDLSLGRRAHLDAATRNAGFRFYERDISAPAAAADCLRAACAWQGVPGIVWHLAANSDIAAGCKDAAIDFKNTLATTFAVIEAAKVHGARSIAFASTSAVYGERDDVLGEDSGPLLPISSYGATKLAGEALLSAAAETFLDRIWIFRFPNVVGPRATHGAIFDFIARLAARPPALTVLGDGSQRKPYLHVAELIEAMNFIVARASARRNVFNIGPEGEGTSVAFMAQRTVARMLPGTPIRYTGGDRGWVGDVPRFRYSTQRLARLGWRPRLSSDEAVLRAIDELVGMSFA
jgi:UDP-glucose 4-epimerase